MDMTKSDASISGISVHQVQLASTLRGLASILEARPLAGHELAIIDVNIHQLSKSLGHNRLKHQYEGSSVRITKLLPRIRASPEKRPLTRLNRETLPPNKASLAFRRFGTLHGDLERSCLTESGIQRELFLDSPLPISMQGGLLEEINVLHEPQGHVYSTTDQLEQGPPTPKIMHHLQSRLENLVSQFLLCQERAKVCSSMLDMMMTINMVIEYCDSGLSYNGFCCFQDGLSQICQSKAVSVM